MFFIILAVHITLCVILIGLVLLQQGKGADAGAIMGGGGDSLFGPASASSAVSKVTTSIAIGFMITSILLVNAYQHRTLSPTRAADPLAGSVLEGNAGTDSAQESGE